ncbi:MAG: hypothetical protein ABJ004_06820 [Cyclobacteriaceae bacterium]
MSGKKQECPSCAMEVDQSEKQCPICGYEFPKQSMWVQALAVLLILVFLYFMLFY